ncbi:hypothetical protein THAOC_29722 [Thalassiosira oceanica]|uniref:Uncharacterized protein n=1 Tax=Thalassiosira oceanica TaxID=159749 RepID=K0RQM0_THAOC|nr:hypothetical protein THAOC_29722 [Thalassiosira oceanica]|eukprot:EJK51136.1 hypothetical protein THAOC_29722 [Thalassiosira oceanica]
MDLAIVYESSSTQAVCNKTYKLRGLQEGQRDIPRPRLRVHEPYRNRTDENSNTPHLIDIRNVHIRPLIRGFGGDRPRVRLYQDGRQQKSVLPRALGEPARPADARPCLAARILREGQLHAQDVGPREDGGRREEGGDEWGRLGPDRRRGRDAVAREGPDRHGRRGGQGGRSRGHTRYRGAERPRPPPGRDGNDGLSGR